jgi:hypothetical protein
MRESLSGREDSFFLHHRLSGYAHAVWEGARWFGRVGRPTEVSSALLIGCGSGTANPYRSYFISRTICEQSRVGQTDREMDG